jgi:hypothetical protein
MELPPCSVLVNGDLSADDEAREARRRVSFEER